MVIRAYNLPMTDRDQIEQTALQLEAARREGTRLPDEVIDWLDYANNELLTS